MPVKYYGKVEFAETCGPQIQIYLRFDNSMTTIDTLS